MGISAHILFKRGNSIEINDLVLRLDELCENEGMYYSHTSNKVDDAGKLKYCEYCVSDIPLYESYDRPICFGIADEPYPYKLVEFDWEPFPQEYFKTLVSGDFVDNEDLLFKFLYVFLHEFPNARVWIEEDWFYTLADLNKLKENYVDHWCYINPSQFQKIKD